MNLARILTMDRPMLEQAWQKHLPKVPIPNLNLRTLRSALAYELQIKETGDISKKTARILRGFLPDVPVASKGADTAEDSARTKTWGQSLPTPPILTIGTVLVREWNGRRYQVQVLDDGFEMDGRVYASLSKIAKLITGTDWSGPRFFGLTKASGPTKAADQPVFPNAFAMEGAA